ncbi:unnamed protein product, partial [Didymodactylos carnosus]
FNLVPADMDVINYKYLNDNHLKGLNNYKYSAVDTSPVSNYIMQPFWNRCVEFFPLWFAPNLMTLLGFLLLVVNFILFSIYDYDFSETTSIPRWLWLVAAIYGMDGKQARRTKASSALGELFDHGVDSWASFLFPVCVFSVLSRDEYGFSVIAMHFLLWTIYISFIDSHWEKYNTKILYLPWSYDISMLCRLVVAQMTSTRSEGLNSFLYVYVPIQCLVVFGNLTKVVEFTLLHLYNIYAIILHIHYAVCVVC